MAIENNVHIPDDILAQASRLAARYGRSADELTTDALKRYIARELLEELSRFGQQRSREMGLDKLSEDEQMEFNRMIHESRQERARRVEAPERLRGPRRSHR